MKRKRSLDFGKGDCLLVRFLEAVAPLIVFAGVIGGLTLLICFGCHASLLGGYKPGTSPTAFSSPLAMPDDGGTWDVIYTAGVAVLGGAMLMIRKWLRSRKPPTPTSLQ